MVARPLLFRSDPETTHERVGSLLRGIDQMGGTALLEALYHTGKTPRLEQDVGGLHFLHPVGLAAGFDKTGTLYPSLSRMGFSFIETGTFTAHPQDGNPKPRLFRFPAQKAILNRMGFNNPGSEAASRTFARVSLENLPEQYALRAINIGKSKIAELEDAVEDYRKSASDLAPHAHSITINVSSPNTPGLRELQKTEHLKRIIETVLQELDRSGRKIPLFVKVAPDMNLSDFDLILDLVLNSGVEGIILTNTTIDRSSLPRSFQNEAGGVSGEPVREISTSMIRHARKFLKGKKTIIGAGGVFHFDHALEKIQAGANLIQVYTGYIYEGPGMPGRIVKELSRFCERENASIQDVVGSRTD